MDSLEQYQGSEQKWTLKGGFPVGGGVGGGQPNLQPDHGLKAAQESLIGGKNSQCYPEHPDIKSDNSENRLMCQSSPTQNSDYRNTSNPADGVFHDHPRPMTRSGKW